MFQLSYIFLGKTKHSLTHTKKKEIELIPRRKASRTEAFASSSETVPKTLPRGDAPKPTQLSFSPMFPSSRSSSLAIWFWVIRVFGIWANCWRWKWRKKERKKERDFNGQLMETGLECTGGLDWTGLDWILNSRQYGFCWSQCSFVETALTVKDNFFFLFWYCLFFSFKLVDFTNDAQIV